PRDTDTSALDRSVLDASVAMAPWVDAPMTDASVAPPSLVERSAADAPVPCASPDVSEARPSFVGVRVGVSEAGAADGAGSHVTASAVDLPQADTIEGDVPNQAVHVLRRSTSFFFWPCQPSSSHRA